jgi:hypothetical protein
MNKISWVDEEIPSILSSATMEEREREELSWVEKKGPLYRSLQIQPLPAIFA